jgi:DnaK suppressor protein
MQNLDLESFRRTLETMLQTAEQPLGRRDEIAVESVPDTLDRVQRETERELAIRQIESSFSRMQKIRLALARIEEGSYGTCLGCDAEISPKRLHAVPWTEYCVRCQEIADREHSENEADRLSFNLQHIG